MKISVVDVSVVDVIKELCLDRSKMLDSEENSVDYQSGLFDGYTRAIQKTIDYIIEKK